MGFQGFGSMVLGFCCRIRGIRRRGKGIGFLGLGLTVKGSLLKGLIK